MINRPATQPTPTGLSEGREISMIDKPADSPVQEGEPAQIASTVGWEEKELEESPSPQAQPSPLSGDELAALLELAAGEL